ncbi:hypothetical protein, partial [Enterococcus sp. C76]
IKEATKKNSLIGEFFSSSELVNFLNCQQVISVKRIEKRVNFSLSELKCNEFLLIPISVEKKFDDEMLYGMHWVCVIERVKKIYVIDSETKKVSEINDLSDYIQRNQKFVNKEFNWYLWKKYFTCSVGRILLYKKLIFPHYIRKYLIECLQRIKGINLDDSLVKMNDVELVKITF